MTVHRDEVIKFCNEYLGVYAFDDFGPQGCQFLGAPEVKKIATSVSLNAEAIYKAGREREAADMLITHHGMFWNTEPHVIDKRTRMRMYGLEKNNLTLLGYHLCLDAHPEIGNNILALQALDATNVRPFGEIGWGGDINIGDLHSIASRISNYFGGGIAYRYLYGEQFPKSVAIITGKGGNYIHEAVREGYDLFITGEAEEPTIALAKEFKISFIGAGHHNSERQGVMALGEKLAKEFMIEHVFIDIKNPV